MCHTIKLTIEYDGSPYAGWQLQPDAVTVQGKIEQALRTLTGEAIRITGAGRTDTGVHALGQVASFQCSRHLPLKAYRDGLNTFLPSTIRILESEEVDETFNARYSAKGRSYRYVLSKRDRAIGAQYAWCPDYSYQLKTMKKASRYLLGEHCFLSFCKRGSEKGEFMSRITSVRWKELTEEIHFEISAVRFFHNMVRIILGTLLEVGRGRFSVRDFRDILDSKKRENAGPTIPPNGLYLLKVDYD